MTGRERLTAAMHGDPVDRAPIWLREGFEKVARFPSKGDFLNGWKSDPTYQKLYSEIIDAADTVQSWGAGKMNRFLMIPDEVIERTDFEIRGKNMFRHGIIKTPDGDLPFTQQWKYHNNNGWFVKHPVNSLRDLISVSKIPWSIDRKQVENQAAEAYARACAEVVDEGIMRYSLSSPIVIISGLMSLQLFLELSYVEKQLMTELLKEITRRILEVLQVVFKGDKRCETAANLGGSEQVTPPMMAPSMFDEFVVPYDGKIIDFLKSKGIPVNVHCHGKIRYALKCLKEMGVDSTDPVEPPPAGDVSFQDAQEIADDEVTLVGNLEYNEFTHLDPPAIRRRVANLFKNGNRRIILSTSAGPNTYISQHVADNYRAFVHAGLEFGGN